MIKKKVVGGDEDNEDDKDDEDDEDSNSYLVIRIILCLVINLI